MIEKTLLTETGQNTYLVAPPDGWGVDGNLGQFPENPRRPFMVYDPDSDVRDGIRHGKWVHFPEGRGEGNGYHLRGRVFVYHNPNKKTPNIDAVVRGLWERSKPNMEFTSLQLLQIRKAMVQFGLDCSRCSEFRRECEIETYGKERW